MVLYVIIYKMKTKVTLVFDNVSLECPFYKDLLTNQHGYFTKHNNLIFQGNPLNYLRHLLYTHYNTTLDFLSWPLTSSSKITLTYSSLDLDYIYIERVTVDTTDMRNQRFESLLDDCEPCYSSSGISGERVCKVKPFI